jgi:protease PrsW
MVDFEPWLIFALALAPGIFWTWYFYRRDRYEPEPASLIAKMFFLGVLVTFPVALVEGFFSLLIVSPLIMGAVVAPIVEEYGKYFVVRRYVYRDREFDEPMDGIVYASATALGLATLENVLYVFSAYLVSPTLAVGTIIIRAIFSVPGHALFSVIWGYALGRAKFMPPERRERIIVLGLVLAMVLHGIFNFLLITAEIFVFTIIVFVLILIPGLWILANRNIGEALRAGRRMR